ncbi:hypothetical protein LTT66_03015 [Nocardia gipuzkoensis]|uniref:type VII secretion target n=1 Tax=Nocardia gipuzkoensis TaxID=2749991 RepID=UPI001E4A1CE6|nr:type VII secretion target [Nocardia gipuzkoensis]UGT69199.1 hypothetical protein LTT66_03015 [Nocardia gipuzkoensis]
MPNYLDVEPDQLRRIAKQHDLAAGNIRKWGEVPHGWLADFESGYGMIADPVRAALVDYYNRRHETAERLAANHERSRDELLAAADALEDADQSGGQRVGGAGDFGNGVPRGGPAPGGSPDPSTPTESSPGVLPAKDTPFAPPSTPTSPATSPATTLPDAPSILGEETRTDDQPLMPANASAPQTYGTPPTELIAPVGPVQYAAGESEPSIDDRTVTPAVDPGGTATVAVDSNSAAGTVGGLDALPVANSLAAAAAVTGAGIAGGMPAPLATGPFVAAAHLSEDKRALPLLVVGERVEDDLALARTLLGATLAAVADSAPGLEWAVAVGRTPVGPIVVLTSAEGRGWLPPGLFLPCEVSLPWRWDFVFGGAAGRQTVAALEGTADPARMLAEFGVMVGGRKNVRISALVSSGAIHDDLRAALGDDVALEGGVSAAESAVDFTSPGVGLVDRLTLAGSGELLQQAATVSDREIWAKCLELARAADGRVRAAVSGIDGETYAHRAHRQRILDALEAGQPIPASWWDEVRAADDTMAAALRSQRVDVSHLPVGEVRPDVSGAEVSRDMFFERRAGEVLLLLAAGEPGRQTLRDVLYSYGQIAEHPLLPAAHAMETIGVRPAPADTGAGRSVGSDAYGAGSISVSPIGVGGPPASIAELWNGSKVSGGSGEKRTG